MAFVKGQNDDRHRWRAFVHRCVGGSSLLCFEAQGDRLVDAIVELRAPCPVCDLGPADDEGATWQDVVCPGCERYRVDPDPEVTHAAWCEGLRRCLEAPP